MPMIAGSVDGAGVGTGMAKALFDAESGPITGDSSLSAAMKAALLTGLAARCTSHALAVVTYVQANAVVSSITACPAGAGTGMGPVT